MLQTMNLELLYMSCCWNPFVMPDAHRLAITHTPTNPFTQDISRFEYAFKRVRFSSALQNPSCFKYRSFILYMPECLYHATVATRMNEPIRLTVLALLVRNISMRTGS